MNNSNPQKAPKEPDPPAQIVREHQKNQRQREIHDSRLGGLQTLATNINTYNGAYAAPEREWELVEKIIELKSISEKIESFNQMLSKYPICLYLEETATGWGFKETSNDRQGDALLHLWWYYFRDEGWIRLKRCLQCKEWFVDSTRNKSALRCSIGCNSLWWSRDRREKARHKHQKKGGKAHGTKKR